MQAFLSSEPATEKNQRKMLRTLRRVNENFSINNPISQASRSFSITPVARSSTAEPHQEGIAAC